MRDDTLTCYGRNAREVKQVLDDRDGHEAPHPRAASMSAAALAGEDRYQSHVGLLAFDAQKGQQRRSLRSLSVLAPLQELRPTANGVHAETFVVPSGSWGETRHVEHLVAKRRVTSFHRGGWNLVALSVSRLVWAARR